MQHEAAATVDKQAQSLAIQQVLQMTTGFFISQTLFAAHDLGIFQALAEGPATAQELTARLNLHPQAGPRLLTACTALGLLELRDKQYANSSIAEIALVKGRPSYMGGMLWHGSRDLYPLWAHLDDAVRENRPRWEQTFQAEGANPFEQMYKDPESLRGFLYAMQGMSTVGVEGLLEAYDFSQHRCFMDVGGALGTVALAVARKYPQLEAITFDLPPVLPLATENITSQGLGNRVRAVAGDMFKDELPREADVIHLSYILHDWADEQCAVILRNCFNALPSGGAILLGEALLDEDGSGPLLPALMSLNMLVATDGGRERTESEYRALLEGAGFTDVKAQRLPNVRDLISARKP